MAEEFGTCFAERFEVVGFDDGGILLDLWTGDFYRLSISAASICSTLKRGQSVAKEELELISQQLVARPARSPSLKFLPDRDVYRMFWKGTEVLRIQSQTLEFSTVGERLPSDFPPETCLLSAAIHFVLPRYGTVLHAAAIAWQGKARVFLGRSGAGKTTTAEAFVQAGCDAVASDLLVTGSNKFGEPIAWVDAERRLHTWAHEHAGIFEMHPARVRTDDWMQPNGQTAPIETLWFLNARNRGGNSLSTRLLNRPHALGLMLDGGFGAVEQREDWLRLLNAGQHLVDRIPTHLVRVPSGNDELGVAVQRYISKMKS